MISISIICATIDSSDLINKSLQSINKSCRNIDISIQFILISQNIDAPCILRPIDNDNLSITIIHSKIRGLSLNRNIGLREAKCDWVMFWDADCLIDVNFFLNLKLLIEKNPKLTIFFGKINSIERGKSILRSWPSFPKNVTRFKVWQLATSVNGVWKKKSFSHVMEFDESFGIGARFGSCEDVDFYVKLEKPAYYSPDLITYHPHQDLTNVDMNKILSYSYGFGALCKKHIHGYGIFYFISSIIKKIITLISFGISPREFNLIIKARVNGFLEFNGTKRQ